MKVGGFAPKVLLPGHVTSSIHRSVHLYYGSWLGGHSVNDFTSMVEAKAAYGEAKGKVQPGGGL